MKWPTRFAFGTASTAKARCSSLVDFRWAETASGAGPAALNRMSSIQETFLASGDAESVRAGRTAEVDATVREAYTRVLAPAFPSGLTMLAVGGYGRQELFPNSDIDIMLLVERPIQAQAAKDAL